MGKTSPTVTVIIAAWKRFECLKKAIKSVLNQTFQDFEVLVVAEDDDELYPQIKKICKEFNDDRIRVIRREKPSITSSRNCGIRNARIKAISLNENVPLATAIINDEGWSELYIHQLLDYYMKKVTYS